MLAPFTFNGSIFLRNMFGLTTEQELWNTFVYIVFLYSLQVESIEVTFFATDSMDVTSVLTPFVEICGCVNDGNCTFNVPDPDTSPLIMACDCPPGTHSSLLWGCMLYYFVRNVNTVKHHQ